MPSTPCPLCDSDAQFVTTSAPAGKLVTCPSCTEFWIDQPSHDHIESWVEVFRTETREQLQGMARRAGPGYRLVMRQTRPEERGGDGRGVAEGKMIAKVLPVTP